MSLPKTAEIAILATTGSVLYVGKTSAERGRITFTTDDVLTRTVDITRIQVPPRAPKRQSKGCLFFCQSILAKTVKTPGIPTKPEPQGLLCLLYEILMPLQVFLLVFVAYVGGPMAELVVNADMVGNNWDLV